MREYDSVSGKHQMRQELSEAQNWRCPCGRHIEPLPDGAKSPDVIQSLSACRRERKKELIAYRDRMPTLERVVPGIMGGQYVRSNLVILCERCNHNNGVVVYEFLKAKNLVRTPGSKSKQPPVPEDVILEYLKMLGLDEIPAHDYED